jgi:hypothetical protein
MEGSFDRHKEMLEMYRENLAALSIDKIEQQLKKMRARKESWDNYFSQALIAEIKSRGHDLDLQNYKIIYHL